ncbi:MAG: hypothetical protein FJ293_11230 [Planctomycetes bacterium]|nr:hypothetical protein [Planctomycetota bacterium]
MRSIGQARTPVTALGGRRTFARRAAAVLWIAASLLPGFAAAAPQTTSAADWRRVLDATDHSPQRIVYRPAGASTAATRRAIRERIGATIDRELWRGAIYRLELPADTDLAAALESLNASGLVRYAEPDYRGRLTDIPNDPYFPLQWSHSQPSDADIDAPEMWDIANQAQDVIVAVIDTGIAYGHSDLRKQMWRNPGEIADNGLDDDANGWIDDVHGIDVLNNDGDPLDDVDHGTAVASIIGATTNNRAGMAGIARGVCLMALKMADLHNLPDVSSIIVALQYAVDHGAHVANNSWVFGTTFSQALYDGFDAAGDAGLLSVMAAGNESLDLDGTPSYPAAFDLPEIITVVATEESDRLTDFSNWGRLSTDLGAPGQNLVIATIDGGYSILGAGTSYAAPFVTGVAALLRSSDVTRDILQIKDWLLDSVDPIPSLKPDCVSGGRLNGRRAVERAAVSRLDRALWTADATIAGGQFGTALARSGDLDGDAIDDVIVGAEAELVGSDDCGVVHLRSGDDGAELRSIGGPPQSGARFGAAVAGCSDSDGDGVADVIIAMPGFDQGALTDCGGVRVVSGATGATIVERIGSANAEGLGTALLTMGDIDGDGHDDFAVSSPGNRNVSLHSSADGATIWSTSRSAFPGFGSALARAADRDGDGVGDLLVGAPGGNRCFVLSGRTGAELARISLGGIARLGAAIADGGDVDHDGVGDVLVGNDGDRLAVRMVSGASGTVLWELAIRTGAANAVVTLAAAGDIDRDRLADWWIAWPGIDAVELRSGASGMLLQVIDGVDGSWFGGSLSSDLDLDGDGGGDLLVGAPLADPNGLADSGSVHAFAALALRLTVAPGVAEEGDDVDLAVTGGITGQPVLLAITAIDDVPVFGEMLLDLLGEFGQYHVQCPVPAGAAGATYELMAWSLRFDRLRIVASNRAELTVN